MRLTGKSALTKIQLKVKTVSFWSQTVSGFLKEVELFCGGGGNVTIVSCAKRKSKWAALKLSGLCGQCWSLFWNTVWFWERLWINANCYCWVLIYGWTTGRKMDRKFWCRTLIFIHSATFILLPHQKKQKNKQKTQLLYLCWKTC